MISRKTLVFTNHHTGKWRGMLAGCPFWDGGDLVGFSECISKTRILKKIFWLVRYQMWIDEHIHIFINPNDIIPLWFKLSTMGIKYSNYRIYDNYFHFEIFIRPTDYIVLHLAG